MKELAASIDTALILMGIFGVVFAIAGVITTPFLLRVVLNTPEKLLPYSITYFRIYCIGLVFQFIYNGIAFVLRGMGDSRATLYFLIISTVLNVVLTTVFVIVFRWSVAGSAIATVIAQVVCAGISYAYLRKRFRLERNSRHFDGSICRHILRLGIPSAIQQTILSLGGSAMQRLVNGFGESAIAAYAAALRINMLMSVPIFGFQAGLASFTGQNIGAGRVDRVKRGLRGTLIMGLSLSVALCLVTYFFAPGFVRMFALDGDALLLGIKQVRFFSYVFCVFTSYCIVGGVLQGSGDVILQTVATMSALTIRVALGYIGVAVGFFGYNAAWVTNPIGWVAAMAITFTRYFSGKWKTKAVATRSPGDEEGSPAPAVVCAEQEV